MVVTDTAPSREGARTQGRGLRILTLHRKRGDTYGFHLKGGKEHGTGFFISHVEEGSVAHLQGIKVSLWALKYVDVRMGTEMWRCQSGH